MSSESEEEVALSGGRITKGVVRVNDTVRRPVGAHSDYVHRLLDHLAGAGLTWVPRYLGQDHRGREILTFQPGAVPQPLPRGRWAEPQVRAAAILLRRLHDATTSSSLADDQPVVCHNDFGPHNLVFSAGTPSAGSDHAQIESPPVGVIDFDQAAPGEREDDVAYAAWLWFLGPEDENRLERQLALLAEFIGAYGPSTLDLRGFGARTAARAERERVMHERAGRPSPPGSWLHRQIAWLSTNAERFDRWALTTP